MQRVEIYTKATCGFCVRAKQLLNAKNVAYDEYAIDRDGAKRDEMIGRANGRMTVPQIFIGGQHVGGCDDLFSLDRRGALDAMLAG